MATIANSSRRRRSEGVLPLMEPGDHLDQPTFHARYEQMPEELKAELIGGVVYMPAALRGPHGKFHMLLNLWLSHYWIATPGSEAFDNTTVILGDQSQPQPDAFLRIIGGRSRDRDDGYVIGPPELVVEVASSSESYDLHAKKLDYERFGVLEYLVLELRESKASWFAQKQGKFELLSAGPESVIRSQQFPGLWFDPIAFFAIDGQRMLDVLKRGTSTDEHAAFVAKLARDRA